MDLIDRDNLKQMFLEHLGRGWDDTYRTEIMSCVMPIVEVMEPYPEPDGDQMTVDAYKSKVNWMQSFARFKEKDMEALNARLKREEEDNHALREQNRVMYEKIDKLVYKILETFGISADELDGW